MAWSVQCFFRELDMIQDIKFVHPKDVQDGKVDITGNDITTNLPFDPRVGIAFDHHESELVCNSPDSFKGRYVCIPTAKSAVSVVYNYYGGREKFRTVTPEILEAVDKGDCADFTVDEILHPSGWVLMDFYGRENRSRKIPRFRISNYDLMMELISYCTDHNVDEVLMLPDVRERVDMYFEQQEKFVAQLRDTVKIVGKVAVIDLRPLDIIYTGNRFMVYALGRRLEISVHVAWGFHKQNTAVMIGKPIVNRANRTDIGALCLSYGGGGHANAGTWSA